ncbi:hypothetical protein HHK36_006626 [Tetracentron sinense]|uniref:Nucleotide-diphospho-sugar transferase domain-containing protein n=1 Tax=Tetracentron sinense TaxID=13715 RepID=A0A835DPC7_TETSI|nr:hypothetical protein HHK36_006626 [Tetracentron sinense]
MIGYKAEKGPDSGALLRRILKLALILGATALSCVVLYNYKDVYPFQVLPRSSRFNDDVSSFHTNASSDSEELMRLEKVLKKAAMEDRTVILTTLNEAWTSPDSIFDLFLESFQTGDHTHRLLDHLVVIALDQKAYARCMTIHNHCFSLVTGGVNFSREAYFMNPEYLKMMWRRIDFLRTVLEMGYNFIFTDSDIMWLRDPFPRFYVDADFQIACDHFDGNSYDMGNMPNAGFNYVKSNNRSIEFYKFWYLSRETYPGKHDQDVLNRIKNDKFITDIGLKMRFLDTAYFGGFCEPSKDFNLVCTMHANCCFGLDNKLHDLRIILEDWKNFMSLSPIMKNSSLSSWRVPQHCRYDGYFHTYSSNFFLFDIYHTIEKYTVNYVLYLLKDSEELMRLEKVLKKAAMEDRTVILTTLNEAWTSPDSIFDLFLESFQTGDHTHRLLDHLVVIALDQKAYARCMTIHNHCFSLVTGGVNFSREAYFMNPEYLKMMWRRIDFLRTVLEMGYNFIFTDSDIMWLRDPFPRFYVDADFQIACDHFDGNSYDMGNMPNAGFNYVKSNNRSIEFYKFWYLSRETYPGKHDQDVLNRIKNDKFITDIGLKMRFLDTAYFGGFCEPSKDFNLVCTMHANCCFGLDNKLHDLRIILEDWKNFMSLSPIMKNSSLSSWRVPQHCRYDGYFHTYSSNFFLFDIYHTIEKYTVNYVLYLLKVFMVYK